MCLLSGAAHGIYGTGDSAAEIVIVSKYKKIQVELKIG